MHLDKFDFAEHLHENDSMKVACSINSTAGLEPSAFAHAADSMSSSDKTHLDVCGTTRS